MLVCVYVCESEADLSRGFNAPDETEEDDQPGHSQAAQDRETDLSKVSNIIRDVQHIVSEKERERDRLNLGRFRMALGLLFFNKMKKLLILTANNGKSTPVSAQ